jgi:SAM-dependent methyltransferase
MGRNRIYDGLVGPPDAYDLLGLHQLDVLVTLGLREGDSVLDVGAGNGRAGRFICRYTPEYYVVEPELKVWDTREPTTVAKGVCTRTDFDFSEFNTKFDYILCHALLTHLPIVRVRACLAGIAKALKPNGLGLVTVSTTLAREDEYTGNAWHPKVAEYRVDTLLDACRNAGLHGRFLGIPHPKGQRWILLNR